MIYSIFLIDNYHKKIELYWILRLQWVLYFEVNAKLKLVDGLIVDAKCSLNLIESG